MDVLRAIAGRRLSACALAVRAGLVAALGYACIGLARAEHPMLLEDTNTLGTGHVELEVGGALIRGDPALGGNGAAFEPQLTIGLTPNLDLIMQGRRLSQARTGEPTVGGIGDSLLDLKWRMHQAGALAYAVRGGLDLPTGDRSKGLSTGSVGFHVLGVASIEWAPVTLLANIAYARLRQMGARANNYAASVAIASPQDAPVRTFIEAAAVTNGDPDDRRWPAVARTGVMVNINPNLIVDIGYQARLNASAPRQVVLAGFTVLW
jgi:hypothetical protein